MTAVVAACDLSCLVVMFLDVVAMAIGHRQHLPQPSQGSFTMYGSLSGGVCGWGKGGGVRIRERVGLLTASCSAQGSERERGGGLGGGGYETWGRVV